MWWMLMSATARGLFCLTLVSKDYLCLEQKRLAFIKPPPTNNDWVRICAHVFKKAHLNSSETAAVLDQHYKRALRQIWLMGPITISWWCDLSVNLCAISATWNHLLVTTLKRHVTNEDAHLGRSIRAMLTWASIACYDEVSDHGYNSVPKRL